MTIARRLLVALVAVALIGVVGAGPASAGPLVDRAAEALRSDPVFVDGAAERKISGPEAEQLRERIRNGGKPVFVAVLPQAATAEAGGDPGRLAVALGEATRREGTYAVLAGNSFRAASTTLPTGAAGSLATAAFDARRSEGPAAVLLGFVDRVNQSSSGDSPGSRQGSGEGSEEPGGSSGGGVGLLLPLLLVGAAGGGGGYLLWRKRRKAQEAQEVRDAREGLRPYLQLLADDVLALEPEVEIHPDAQGDYDAAVNRYRAADAAMDQVRSMAQVERLGRLLAEGNYAMARVRARVDGREPPPPPPELASPGPNQEPAVVVDERGEPAYAGYGGGWYGGGGWFGGGDMLSGILIGSMLGGGGWGWGGGYGHHDAGHHDHGGESGDQGGGDRGGGDFGGGDFGGGDFGGGGDF